MRRRPVYIAVLAIAAIALMLAVLTLYAGSRKAPAARSAASAPADVEQTLSPSPPERTARCLPPILPTAPFPIMSLTICAP